MTVRPRLVAQKHGLRDCARPRTAHATARDSRRCRARRGQKPRNRSKACARAALLRHSALICACSSPSGSGFMQGCSAQGIPVQHRGDLRCRLKVGLLLPSSNCPSPCADLARHLWSSEGALAQRPFWLPPCSPPLFLPSPCLVLLRRPRRPLQPPRRLLSCHQRRHHADRPVRCTAVPRALRGADACRCPDRRVGGRAAGDLRGLPVLGGRDAGLDQRPRLGDPGPGHQWQRPSLRGR